MTIQQLVSGEVYDPHALLGAHPSGEDTVVRAYRRGAASVAVLAGAQRYPMTELHEVGVFEATVPGRVLDYELEVDGRRVDDPYRYPPTIGDLDLHLITEGRHERLWTALGARPRDGGVAFAVWAPSARAVRVIGDFTGWGVYDGWPMRSMGASGVWELFVPGAKSGDRYKYRILGPDGAWRDKADPLAQHTEVPPKTASVVYASTYEWGDEAWLAARATRAPHEEPMSVYEVHLGSWRQGLGYREAADQLIDEAMRLV